MYSESPPITLNVLKITVEASIIIFIGLSGTRPQQ